VKGIFMSDMMMASVAYANEFTESEMLMNTWCGATGKKERANDKFPA
jgi:hypothetical protein